VVLILRLISICRLPYFKLDNKLSNNIALSEASANDVAVGLGDVENDCLPQNMNTRLAEGGDNCLGVYLQTGLM